MALPEKRGKYQAIRRISRITILGGVHGNERTGIHVLQIIRKNPNQFKTGNIQQVQTILGNPRAIYRNTRYIEEDLNRKFQYHYTNSASVAGLRNSLRKSPSYEAKRALEIRGEMGAMTKPADFLIDLHTTTANMGNCLIVSDDDPWTEVLCAELAPHIRNCRILFDPVPREKDTNSSSLAMNSITLEMGPIQQGVPDQNKILEAAAIVKKIIEGVNALNGLSVENTGNRRLPLKFTSLRCRVDYPRDRTGTPTAILHPDFYGRDFKSMKMGRPLFIKPNGNSIRLEKGRRFPPSLIRHLEQGRKVYPFFIGEAAYIEKGIAFLSALGNR